MTEPSVAGTGGQGGQGAVGGAGGNAEGPHFTMLSAENWNVTIKGGKLLQYTVESCP
jgi:hypothetical protein